MAHTPKNQSEKAILTARRAWCYLVLVLISFLCLFFFYVLIINSTRTHFEIQKGFSLMPGKSIITNFRKLYNRKDITVEMRLQPLLPWKNVPLKETLEYGEMTPETDETILGAKGILPL